MEKNEAFLKFMKDNLLSMNIISRRSGICFVSINRFITNNNKKSHIRTIKCIIEKGLGISINQAKELGIID
jgi:hypothetical protein